MMFIFIIYNCLFAPYLKCRLLNSIEIIKFGLKSLKMTVILNYIFVHISRVVIIVQRFADFNHGCNGINTVLCDVLFSELVLLVSNVNF